MIKFNQSMEEGLGELNPINAGQSFAQECPPQLHSRVMVAHEENVNYILDIILAHSTESSLPSKPNLFTSFNSGGHTYQ